MQTSLSKNKSFQNLFRLQNKVAVVTGGAGILGREFCYGLAEFGAQVAVVDVRAKEARELAASLKEEYGIEACGMDCDVSQAASVKEMVKAAVDQFGHIDILLNNAAHKTKDLDSFFEKFESYSLAQWQEVMAVNLDGMFAVAQAVGDQMVKQGKGGSIIQTASIYGMMAPDPRVYEGSHYLGREINTPAVYAASKGAVLALTKYLSTYWADQKIRVNSLTPGGVESGQNETFKKKYAQRVPLKRMAFPSEMVGAVIFLASEASSYVTGQNLVVDGGLSTW